MARHGRQSNGAQSAAVVATWLVSLALHGLTITALCRASRGPHPATAGPASRQIEIQLLPGSAAKNSSAETTHYVELAAYAAPLSAARPSAPQLLQHAQPITPAAHANLAPASFTPIATGQPLAASPATPGQPHAAQTQLFGVHGRGNRFVYVFDRSASMEGRPLAAAKRELAASLRDLAPANPFQIIFYNETPLLMPPPRGRRPGLVPADEQGKRQAASFMGGILADGPTNHLAALTTALHLRPDVIFLLTDAEEPQLRDEDLLYLRRLNRATVIHTIEFGAGPPRPEPNFLQRLAIDSGGQHAYIDTTRLW
jgi:hypothetical protein